MVKSILFLWFVRNKWWKTCEHRNKTTASCGPVMSAAHQTLSGVSKPVLQGPQSVRVSALPENGRKGRCWIGALVGLLWTPTDHYMSKGDTTTSSIYYMSPDEPLNHQFLQCFQYIPSQTLGMTLLQSTQLLPVLLIQSANFNIYFWNAVMHCQDGRWLNIFYILCILRKIYSIGREKQENTCLLVYCYARHAFLFASFA